MCQKPRLCELLSIGAGGHGQVVADALIAARRAGGNLLVPLVFVDDLPTLWNQQVLRLPVEGGLDRLGALSYDRFVVAIGNNRNRSEISKSLSNVARRLVTVKHPSTTLAPDVQIADGSMICAGVIVNTGSVIGANTILNTGCTVDHHCSIGDYVHIAPGVHLGGTVTIGDGTLVGMGSAILPGVRVGSWTTIGAGAVVIEDLPDGVTAVGNPARIIKRHS
jgi:sugar O-acyltransferase (sialic acid O-acetyltransferase NeuD family)